MSEEGGEQKRGEQQQTSKLRHQQTRGALPKSMYTHKQSTHTDEKCAKTDRENEWQDWRAFTSRFVLLTPEASKQERAFF